MSGTARRPYRRAGLPRPADLRGSACRSRHTVVAPLQAMWRSSPMPSKSFDEHATSVLPHCRPTTASDSNSTFARGVPSCRHGRQHDRAEGCEHQTHGTYVDADQPHAPPVQRALANCDEAKSHHPSIDNASDLRLLASGVASESACCAGRKSESEPRCVTSYTHTSKQVIRTSS